MPRAVKVVRSGVDKEPKVMEIHLLDTKAKRTLPVVVWLGNLTEATVEQGIIIDELLSTLCQMASSKKKI